MDSAWRGTIRTALALALLAGPLAAPAGAVCSREGDPAFYVGFGADRTVAPGETITLYLAPCNFAILSSCDDADTFCVHVTDTGNWTIGGDPSLGDCILLEPGYFLHQYVSISAPCGAATGDRDTIVAVMAYCGGGACDPSCLDTPGCEDPNLWEGKYYWSADTLVLEVTDSPPWVYVLNDTLLLAAYGQETNFLPFSICNGDPCSPVDTIDYEFSGAGLIPWNPGYPRTGSVAVAGGACEKIYAVLDASVSEVCDFDTVTLVAWDRATGLSRDTGAAAVHVIPVCPVPVLSPNAVALLAAAALAAGAIFLRRRTRPARG
ncbi:MAG: hypothetical protein JW876_08285 [Candidatus Krumholzibacteriota bacterium]|nr:hypothetical protein [Candidatus Krumholzibacteriota bacterium]